MLHVTGIGPSRDPKVIYDENLKVWVEWPKRRNQFPLYWVGQGDAHHSSQVMIGLEEISGTVSSIEVTKRSEDTLDDPSACVCACPDVVVGLPIIDHSWFDVEDASEVTYELEVVEIAITVGVSHIAVSLLPEVTVSTIVRCGPVRFGLDSTACIRLLELTDISEPDMSRWRSNHLAPHGGRALT